MDPSYFWMFTTLAVFLVFGHIRLDGGTFGRAVTWAAERSYSIYLLQLTTIEVVTTAVYHNNLFGVVGTLPGAVRILAWGLTTVAAYLLALLLASVLDTVVVKPIQRLFNRFTVDRLELSRDPV